MRIVIAEDQALLRDGLTRLLEHAGHEVVGALGDADGLLELVAATKPDVVVVDVRMPPTFTDEGTRAAAAIRAADPGIALMVLSQHVEANHTVDLLHGGRFGYLLKDRVIDPEQFLAALERIAAGGSVLDPEVVARLVSTGPGDALAALSPREREVLALMAEGRTNGAIARTLFLAERTVETHVRGVLMKLGLPDGPDDHRRVLAVVQYLSAIRG